MSSSTHTFQVNTKALRTILSRMKKLGGVGKGDIILTLEPKALCVQWSGMCEEIDATGDGNVTVRISGDYMQGLARVLPRTAETTLTYADEKIRFNTLSLSCTRIDEAPPVLLPMKTTPLEVLLLSLREKEEDIENAGLKTSLTEAQQRAQRSIEKASENLRWLNISPTLLNTWVQAHLEATAQGNDTFPLKDTKTLVVSEKGQFSLPDCGG